MVDSLSSARSEASSLAGFASVAERPWAGFFLFAIAHGAIWTLLPYALYANLPLDLIEALTYGREWQIGYDKLPPLPWWLVEIAYRTFGSDIVYYLLGQLSVLAAFAAIWALMLRISNAPTALAAILIIDGLHYFNFTAPKFNHDVDPAAVLGTRRIGVPRRAARRADRLLDRARRRDWNCVLGEIFRRHPLLAARAVHAVRPPGAALLRDARTLWWRPPSRSSSSRRISSGSPTIEFLPFSYLQMRARAPSANFRSPHQSGVLRDRSFSGCCPRHHLAAAAAAPREADATKADDYDRRILALLDLRPGSDRHRRLRAERALRSSACGAIRCGSSSGLGSLSP